MIQSCKKNELAVALVVVVCTVVAVTHRSALSARALFFDDQQYVTRNVLVQNPGWVSAKRFLTEVLRPSTVEGYYQPLAMISLMLDFAAGGRQNNLLPFHITSLALHTANTALIIVLLYLLFDNIWAASAVGLLFGVHPMTVEPIPWVGERKTLLAAFFAFWSLIFYVRFACTGGWKLYTGCFVLYLLALMSKPTSVPLPMVMLLMDYWPLKRLSAKSVLEKLPLFAICVLFAVITYISQSRTAGAVLATKFGFAHVLLVLCHNIIFYLYKIVLPIHLSSHYAFPRILALSDAMVLAGLLGTCILIPVLLVSFHWTKAVLIGWLIFFVAIFPTMGIVGFTNVIASDKYAYLPSVGLLMIAALFLIWICRSSRGRVAAISVVLILSSAEVAATHRQLQYWQDSMVLINRMLVLSPYSSHLYHNRGVIYDERGQFDMAIRDYNKAIELNPELVNAYYNRGNTYCHQGRFDIAVFDYNRAIELAPAFVDAYVNRGNVYKEKGGFDNAIEDYNKAIEMAPELVEAYEGRGSVWECKGQLDNAITDYNKAVELSPKCAKAYYNRGTVYCRKGEHDLAIRDYNKALEINPTYAEACFNKANACELAGRTKEAVEAYKAFIQCAPAGYAVHIKHALERINQLKSQ